MVLGGAAVVVGAAIRAYAVEWIPWYDAAPLDG